MEEQRFRCIKPHVQHIESHCQTLDLRGSNPVLYPLLSLRSEAIIDLLKADLKTEGPPSAMYQRDKVQTLDSKD